MLKNEFLIMQRQDLVTESKPEYQAILLAFEEILKNYPSSTEIDSTKTIIECYKKMEHYAKEHAQNGIYVFLPEDAKKFFIEYLNLGKPSNDFVNLEDFL